MIDYYNIMGCILSIKDTNTQHSDFEYNISNKDKQLCIQKDNNFEHAYFNKKKYERNMLRKSKYIKTFDDKNLIVV